MMNQEFKNYFSRRNLVSQECSHPKGALVVPEKVAPYFNGDILPKPNSSITAKPESFRGKLKYYVDKSALLTGPPLLIGSCSGLALTTVAVPDPTFIFSMAAVIGYYTVGMLGMVGTIRGINSFINGDRKYSPLPPTKEFLALEASKQKPIITPFETWDQMFNKNDARVQNMISTIK